MKKNLLLVISLFSCSSMIQGVVISPEDALRRMGEVKGVSLPTRGGGTPDLLFTSRLATGEAALYVFNVPDSQGYWVLSADDAAAPVLGYSLTGTFNVENIPPQMEWWMKEYGRQINYAREKGMSGYSSATRSDRKAIVPLLSTNWDQGSPFNLQCPEIKGRHALTGCVATAMAQVMKYWNYPETGTGRGTATVPSSSESIDMSFSEQKFDWDNMLDWYGTGAVYTDAQSAAVAYLMKACGFASGMNYSLSSSGALSMHAASALINNFKYNPNIQFMDRDYFTSTEWESMVYDELAAGRPVLYSGVSPSGGHEFVCDGYSSDGYFHFNWGWSGMSDGYFLLDALNPGNLGSGGGEGGGFNYSQDITIGIQPSATAAVSPRLVQLGNLRLVPKFNTLSLKIEYGSSSGFWANMGLSTVNVDLGVAIEPAAGISGAVKYVKFNSGNVSAPKTVSNGDGSYSVSYSGFSGGDVTIPDGLSDGRYKITVCTKGSGAPDTDYVPVLCGSEGYNYAYFTKSGSTYTADNLAAPQIIIKEAGTLSDVYYGLATKMSLTIFNDSEKEITKTFFPRLVSGQTVLESSDGVTVTIGANETVTRDFVTIFEVETGLMAPTSDKVYTLGFYNPATNESYEWTSEVTVKAGAPAPVYTVADFSMPGLSYKDVVLNDEGHTPTRLYSVTDTSDLPFSCVINVEQGYLGFPLYLAICRNEDGNTNLVSASVFNQIPTVSAGQSVNLTQTVDFASGEEGNTYVAYLCEANGNELMPIENATPIFFIIAGSGIDDILADNVALVINYERSTGEILAESPEGIASLSIYSLDGKSVSAEISLNGNSARASLSALPSGVYIVRAVDRNGCVRTFKTAK